MIHLVGPVVLAAALAGTGVYGLIARRNAVLVLIGAELILNAANILLITASSLPAGGLAALTSPGAGGSGSEGPAVADPLLSGQVMTVFVITIAAAEIGLALAVILLLYRRRVTSDLAAVRELGEASATYTIPANAGEWPADAASSDKAGGAGKAGGPDDGAAASSGTGSAPGAGATEGTGASGDAARVPGQRSEVRRQ